jgi:hypothetical protein
MPRTVQRRSDQQIYRGGEDREQSTEGEHASPAEAICVRKKRIQMPAIRRICAIALMMLLSWIFLSPNLANPCFIFMPDPAI